MQTIYIEIFQTNVMDQSAADLIIKNLNSLFPNTQFNFDLDDCDKILRAEGIDFSIEKVENVVKKSGFDCTRII